MAGKIGSAALTIVALGVVGLIVAAITAAILTINGSGQTIEIALSLTAEARLKS